MLSGVTVSCFLLSYLVVLAMEALRFVFKVPGRTKLLIGMLIAGLVAHSIFLVNQFIATDGSQLLANWFQWAVLGAWGLALAYLVLIIRNPQGSFGIFLIPFILALIGLGQLLRDSDPFQAEMTISVWRIIHGVSLIVGTMFICFGVSFGIMYLLQSHRLKKRKKRSPRFQLPTLEFLQSMNRLSLFASTIALAIGMVSGFILNLNRDGQLAWFSSGIVVSCALFGWALMASVVELAGKGSLGGRKSAYLVIANFVFFVMVLGIVLWTSHGQSPGETSPSEQSTSKLSETHQEVLS